MGQTRQVLVGTAVLLALLVVMIPTLMPGVGYWDTGEFQAVGPSLGLAHPTGYPLYILLGKLVSSVPVGHVAWRMNLFSTLCTAGAGATLAGLLSRGGVRAPWAIAAGLAYGLGRNVWNVSTHADPHTLNALCAVVLAGAAWLAVETRTWRNWWLLAACAGLGLGNHMLLVMALPGLVVGVALARPDWVREPGRWGAALAGFALGLMVYAYLPLRAAMNPVVDYHHPVTWERFRYVVLGEQFRGDMGFLSVAGVQAFVGSLPRLGTWLVEWYTLPGAMFLGLATLAGMAVLVRRRAWAWLAGLGLALLVPAYAAGTYQNADLTRYYFISQAIALALAAIGGDAVSGLLPAGRMPWVRQVVWGVPLAVLVLIPVHRAVVDQHWNVDAEQYMRNVLGSVRPGAVIVSWWSLSTPLWYGQAVEGLRPDVLVLDESTLVKLGRPDPLEAVREHVGKRPVYVIHMAYHRDRIRERFLTRELPPTNGVGQPVDEVLGPR